MFMWLLENGGTIVVSLALIGVITLIIVRLRKNQQQGKSTCGCQCASCAMRGSCHPK